MKVDAHKTYFFRSLSHSTLDISRQESTAVAVLAKRRINEVYFTFLDATNKQNVLQLLIWTYSNIDAEQHCDQNVVKPETS